MLSAKKQETWMQKSSCKYMNLLEPKPKSTPDLGNIGKKFQENMIDDMFSDMDMDLYDNI